jgi:hypothetical protein
VKGINVSQYIPDMPKVTELDIGLQLLKSGFYLESLGGFRKSNRIVNRKILLSVNKKYINNYNS